MSTYTKPVYVNNETHVECKPPRRGRSYFFAQNNSAADIYYGEDTVISNVENALKVGAGQTVEFSINMGGPVPQGSVWFHGSAASPTRQLVVVKEAD